MGACYTKPKALDEASTEQSFKLPARAVPAAMPYRNVVLLPRDSQDDLNLMRGDSGSLGQSHDLNLTLGESGSLSRSHDSFSGFGRCHGSPESSFESKPVKRLLKPEEQLPSYMLLLLDDGGRWLADLPVVHGMLLGRGCHPLLTQSDCLSAKQIEVLLKRGGGGGGGAAISVARRGPNPSYVQQLTAAGSHAAPERLEKDATVKIVPGDVIWLGHEHAPLRLVCLLPSATDMRRATVHKRRKSNTRRWSEASDHLNELQVCRRLLPLSPCVPPCTPPPHAPPCTPCNSHAPSLCISAAYPFCRGRRRECAASPSASTKAMVRRPMVMRRTTRSMRTRSSRLRRRALAAGRHLNVGRGSQAWYDLTITRGNMFGFTLRRALSYAGIARAAAVFPILI